MNMREQISSPANIVIPENDYRDCHGQYRSDQSWSVSSSTTSGMKDMYSGTRESVNTFFAQLFQRTGLCQPWRLAKKMGVDPGARVPSWTLGTSPVSPLEMAEAYATFAARGRHCESRPVAQVLDRNGKEIQVDGINCERVIKQSTADAVNDVLRGVIEGGFADAYHLDSDAAGKTGTINGARTVWFIGYTPALTTASMVAGANSEGHWIGLEGQTIGGDYVASASGTELAAPMWYDAMSVIDNWLPNTPFEQPDAKTVNGVPATVPSTGGMSPDDAQRMLNAAGFNAVIGSQVDSSYSYGTVAFTSPGAGSTAYSGQTIVIYISDGTPYVAPQPAPRPDGGGDGGGNGGGGGGDGGGGGGGDGGGGGGGRGGGVGGGRSGGG
jgi:membrane peptidoglycan carboxypeptidase